MPPPTDSTLTDETASPGELESGWLDDQFCAEVTSQANRYAFSVVRSWSDAEEIVQEAFCRLIQKGDVSTSNQKALLFKTIRNLAIDLLRKKGRIKFEPIADWNTPRDNGQNGERLQQLQQTLEQVLAQIPEKWSAALNLKVNAGLGYDEISSVLGATKDQIRIWIYRARKRLHQELRKHDLIEKP